MANSGSKARIGHAAVEAAIRALAATQLSPKADSMLRTFLAFKAVHRGEAQGEVDMTRLRAVVSELFTLLPTPEGVHEANYKGTIRLRGSQGRPVWMVNESWRGAFLDYAGPTSQGRFLFEGSDWRNNLREEAVDVVAETLGGAPRAWPAREALAVIALRNERIDEDLGWSELAELARVRFGLSDEEWLRVTSSQPLGLDPTGGVPWDPARLSPELRPPGTERAQTSERQVEELPAHLGADVERVLTALAKHGQHAIVALAGVPGTSKSYVAKIAARAFASEGCVREIQFSPGYTYEEFMEGPRYGKEMQVEVVPGAFLELNQRAIDDPGHQYALLIEELTRADLPRVLGELLTYVEYRGEKDLFTTMYRREDPIRIAPNVAILATYNPTDHSAVNVDAALIRRMRILDFPPNMELLREILTANGIDPQVIGTLVAMFDACREVAQDRFDETMPFGHAVFAAVEDERGLYELWHEELKRMLVRPHTPPHQLYDVILEHYPWHTWNASASGAPEALPPVATGE